MGSLLIICEQRSNKLISHNHTGPCRVKSKSPCRSSLQHMSKTEIMLFSYSHTEPFQDKQPSGKPMDVIRWSMLASVTARLQQKSCAGWQRNAVSTYHIHINNMTHYLAKLRLRRHYSCKKNNSPISTNQPNYSITSSQQD